MGLFEYYDNCNITCYPQTTGHIFVFFFNVFNRKEIFRICLNFEDNLFMFLNALCICISIIVELEAADRHKCFFLLAGIQSN